LVSTNITSVIVVQIRASQANIFRPRSEINDGQFTDVERLVRPPPDELGGHGNGDDVIAGGNLRRRNSAYGPVGADADTSTNVGHSFSL